MISRCLPAFFAALLLQAAPPGAGAPVIDSLSPASYLPGRTKFRIEGSGFVKGATLRIASASYGRPEVLLREPQATVASPARMDVDLLAAGGAQTLAHGLDGGGATFAVSNPGGGWSNAVAAQPRPLTLHLIYHTHLDIGYTAPPSVVAAGYKRFYDRVVELLERDTAVRFTVETLWQLEQYLARSKPDEIARFFRLVRAGRIEVCAGYDNPNTSAMAYEELGRLFYQAAAIRRKYGIPIETLIFNDQPGYTWGLADIAAASGVRYFLTGINLFDGQSIPGNLFPMTHRPFYWVGRTGDRLLTWPSIGEQERGVRPWDAAAYRCTGCAAYTTADRNLGLVLIEPAAAPPGLDKARWDRENLKARVLKGLAFYADRDYPYPHLLMMAANGDNNSGTKWGHGENFELFEWMTAAVRHLNASEKNLRAVITTPSVFFRLMEREYGHFAALPAPGAAHGGDWPSTWEELDGAAPLSSARIRRARELLVTAEKLAATNTAAGSAAAYPARDFDDAWRLIRLWDEHTSPQFPAPLPFEEIWQHASEHAQFALDSLVIAERLSRQSLSRLAASLAGRRAPRILVFNQTAWARTGLAGCDRPSAGAFRLIDPATGTPVPWQPSVSQPDRILFVAGSVPANGYKVYEVVPGPPGESSKAGPLQVDAGRRSLENLCEVASYVE